MAAQTDRPPEFEVGDYVVLKASAVSGGERAEVAGGDVLVEDPALVLETNRDILLHGARYNFFAKFLALEDFEILMFKAFVFSQIAFFLETEDPLLEALAVTIENFYVEATDRANLLSGLRREYDRRVGFQDEAPAGQTEVRELLKKILDLKKV